MWFVTATSLVLSANGELCSRPGPNEEVVGCFDTPFTNHDTQREPILTAIYLYHSRERGHSTAGVAKSLRVTSLDFRDRPHFSLVEGDLLPACPSRCLEATDWTSS